MSYLKAIGMGALCGLRSMTPPAVLSQELARDESGGDGSSLVHCLAHPARVATLKALAAVEMAADKTPWIPDRTSPVGLVGRAAMGAVVGAALCSGQEENAVAGGALGAASAVAATYAVYHLRRGLGRGLHVPDPVLGVVEDAAVLSGSRSMLHCCGPVGTRESG